MGKKRVWLTILLSFTMLLSGLGANEALKHYTGETAGEHIADLIDIIKGSSPETTGLYTEFAAKFAQEHGQELYMATSERYPGMLDYNSRVSYTPAYIRTTADGNIDLSYISEVLHKEKMLEDLVTATLNLSKNADTTALYNEFEKAFQQGKEKEASEALEKLAVVARVTVSYNKPAENNNENLSGYLASKITADTLPAGLEDSAKTSIMEKIASGDFVVTQFAITPDSTNKGQKQSNVKDEKDEETGEVTATTCDLTARNVELGATLRVAVKDKVYYVNIKQGGLNIDLGRQPWNADGVSAETMAELIDKKYQDLSPEELAAEIAKLIGGSPAVSVFSPELGKQVDSTKKVTISVGFQNVVVDVTPAANTTGAGSAGGDDIPSPEKEEHSGGVEAPQEVDDDLMKADAAKAADIVRQRQQQKQDRATYVNRQNSQYNNYASKQMRRR